MQPRFDGIIHLQVVFEMARGKGDDFALDAPTVEITAGRSGERIAARHFLGVAGNVDRYRQVLTCLEGVDRLAVCMAEIEGSNLLQFSHLVCDQQLSLAHRFRKPSQRQSTRPVDDLLDHDINHRARGRVTRLGRVPVDRRLAEMMQHAARFEIDGQKADTRVSSRLPMVLKNFFPA